MKVRRIFFQRKMGVQGNTLIIFVVLMVLTVSSSQPALATILTVEVEGVVNSVWTDNGLTLDGSVSEGSPMIGFTTYDTETPDLFPQFDHRGEYQLISISMTVGNYTFTNDPISPEAAVFKVQALGNFHHIAQSTTPRFDGIVYIDGSPKTFDEIDFEPLYLAVIYLEADNVYGITDALPDSFMDLSVYRQRSFVVGNYPDHYGPGFRTEGELTSLTVVPEPTTVFLLGLGSLTLLRKRKA